MDTDLIWQHIDEQRLELAALIETLTPEQLATPSLCDAWTVRDVAVHLTHSHTSPIRAMLAACRYGFRFDTMIRELALRDHTSADEAADTLRAMVGSRRHPIGTTPMAPLLDSLLHGQDITVPLAIDRTMPPDAATACAAYLWSTGFPFHARRRNAGRRFVATDSGFAVGEGEVVEAPIRDIVMLFGGRSGAAGVLAPSP
ncbi:maleylpyruvate isomerase family mycothiol-dependent enzyme [Gordonia sp. KTR9]|uniref:maleylpyruvate isomerase family mycothiol-dependent enzyme n=1 Tax=Gordonia sp. KTR9 TaxID=337191 RepID=UPI00027DE961|nr:maleylpyruvate isomerase family mycothiol-dependent enzyme [Gordonia sp. KTR9]AFR49950.1 hypothetical protein KTR9_3315 [Gordonia sp. KTR9]